MQALVTALVVVTIDLSYQKAPLMVSSMVYMFTPIVLFIFTSSLLL